VRSKLKRYKKPKTRRAHGPYLTMMLRLPEGEGLEKGV
jgi:hypothetical protein